MQCGGIMHHTTTTAKRLNSEQKIRLTHLKRYRAITYPIQCRYIKHPFVGNTLNFWIFYFSYFFVWAK